MNKITAYLKLPLTAYLILILLLAGSTSMCQGKLKLLHDTSYYDSYQHSIIARVFLSQKYTSPELRKGNDPPRLRYKPNTKLNLGVGATYRNLTLNIGYGLGFLNDDEAKGKNKKVDLQSHLYGRRWVLDFYGQFYRGYYEIPKGRGSADNTSYYQRPDLKVNVVGVSAYRILNYRKFTMHPSLVQDEVQKKSAGSFIVGAEMYYGTIKGDSALVPSQLALFYDRRFISRSRFLEFGPGIGYAYTQVFPYHLYVTGSLTANANLGLVKETGIMGSSDHLGVNAGLLYRLGGGYNNATWNINLFWINSRLAAKGSLSGNDYLINTGNYRLIFSKRLRPGPRLKKRLKLFDKILPIT